MTLRVVHIVATNAFAGTERYVAVLARAQAERGIATTVIGGMPSSMKALLGTTVNHYAYEGPIQTVRQLRSMGRPDIIHAHLTTAELLACVAFPFRHDVKAVSTRHIAATRGKSLAGRLVARFIRRRLDGQISPSNYIADRIDGPSEVIPTGLPYSPSGTHNDLVVLVAQRLEPEKDTATALRAWALSKLAFSGWNLVVAGTGSEEEPLRQLAEVLGVSDSCTFAGHTDEIAGLMERSAIVMCTATAEPFGLTAVEAMACGAVVVATAAGGHLETIGAVDRSLLYEPRNPSCAADILIGLSRDPARRVELGRRLRLHQQLELAIDPFVDRVSTFYQKLETRLDSSPLRILR